MLQKNSLFISITFTKKLTTETREKKLYNFAFKYLYMHASNLCSLDLDRKLYLPNVDL